MKLVLIFAVVIFAISPLYGKSWIRSSLLDFKPVKALSPVDGVSGVPVHQNGTSGFVNQAFDEPEITEVLSNMAPVHDQKPKIVSF